MNIVECRGFQSEALAVTSGVLQRSILGTLFVIFINKIVQNVYVS